MVLLPGCLGQAAKRFAANVGEGAICSVYLMQAVVWLNNFYPVELSWGQRFSIDLQAQLQSIGSDARAL